MGKSFQKFFLVAALVSIPCFSAFGEEPVVRVAVTDSKPAIREISKGAVGDTSSPETEKVRVIEIVSHAIESSDKTARQENEVSAKSEEAMPDQKEDRKEDLKEEAEADDEGEEEIGDEAEEETVDDGDSLDDLKKKIAARSGEIEEEPCDCGTIAEGECAPCPEDDLD